MVFQNNVLSGVGGQGDDAFEVPYSCRFNTADTAVLSRANGTATSDKIATIAFWFKIGVIGVDRAFFGAEGFYTGCAFLATGQLYVVHGSGAIVLTTTQAFRDSSAWYHCVCVFDTTESVSTNRFKLFINGVQVTAYTTGTFPTLNEAFTAWNQSGNTNLVGDGHSTYSNYDGYLSEFHSVDGAALAPTVFGEFDDYGVWRPIEVSGVTYGNNGFYLDFADSSDLGNDVSGNDNDLTSSGLAAVDQVLDTPTLNYCTFNPLNKAATYTLSDGNLTTLQSATSTRNATGCTMYCGPTGKFYFEIECVTLANEVQIGVMGLSMDMLLNTSTTTPNAWWYRGADGTTYGDTVAGTTIATFTSGDVISVAVDMDASKIWFGKNGTWQNSGDPAAGTGFLFDTLPDYVSPVFNAYLAGKGTLTCGQTDFAHTVPTGFNHINSANISEPTIKDGTAHFQPIIYTGDGSVRNIDQSQFFSTFKPDNIWIKNRGVADEWKCVDIVRGVTKEISVDSSGVESTDANGLTSFDSDGFGLGTGAGGYNDNTELFAGYQWLAGGDAGSSNEDGSINTTTTSVNTVAGISMGTYTGTGSAATIGHGLGAVPAMIVVKCLNDGTGAGQGHWYVYHKENTSAPETDYLLFNTNAATVDSDAIWNDTAPTSTVFSIGTGVGVNESTNLYGYWAFAEVEGFSKFGTYLGNGVGSGGGTFTYTGFKPTFVIVKRTNSTSQWYVTDTARNPFFTMTQGDFNIYYLDLNFAESTGYGNTLLSNGFKQFDAAENNVNGSTYVYFAFGEYPFGGASTTVAPAF